LKKDLAKQKVNVGDVKSVLADMEVKKKIVVEDGHYFLAKYHRMEVDVAGIMWERGFVSKAGTHLIMNWAERDGFKFDLDQQCAIETALTSNTCIITGGPGTGKTTVTKRICDLVEAQDMGSMILCAPTGKAAKRLEEVTGRKAFTIHRAFRAGFGIWKTGPKDMISCDWLIIDECSMLDIQLAWRVLRATPRRTRIIFVGDKNQLPPVGPGAFLRDLIKSSMIPVCILRQNHRQGEGSLIAENALTINDGGLKLMFNDSDMIYEEASNPIIIREKLLPLVNELGKKFGIDNVQILSPQKQTAVGVEALNRILRFKLNPHADAHEKFSVGDRVMQTQNNYKLDIFNGYVGIIQKVSRERYVIDFFDKGDVEYPRSISDQLIHAYCCTVHKFQGSEVPAGILILSTAHTYMLTRNLIYTGMTRFKKCCVFLGDQMALRRSVTNTRENTRYTKLLERLSKGGGE
jgi:exodeoxyribonuclease V alpha subunit